MATLKSPSLPSYLSLLFLLLLSLHNHLSFAADSLSSNQSLSGSRKLISRDGTFALGFFQPCNSSKNYYIGIWYHKISPLTSVWVANRNTPVSDPTTAEFKIADDGNLVLFNQSKAQVWSTMVTSVAFSSHVAVILDSGNLVLRDASNSSIILWQSFDHPTDTLLPGGKVALNKVTRDVQRLTSWKNYDNPAAGVYSLEIDPSGTNQSLLMWNMSKVYWTSGTWNGVSFSGVPGMIGLLDSPEKDTYSFQYISTDKENYFTYFVKDNTMITRLVMDVSGQTKALAWLENSQKWNPFFSLPIEQCDVYTCCGPFGTCSDEGLTFCSCMKGFSKALPHDWALGDHGSGCLRITPLLCHDKSSANVDTFHELPDMKLPDSPQSSEARSAHDCALACLNNCSCTAYSYGSGCSLWYGDLLNTQQLSDGSGETLHLRLAANSDIPSSKSKKRSGPVWEVVGVVAGLAACSAIVFVLVWRQRTREMKIFNAQGNTLVPYQYSDLRRATDHFSKKLGDGGFGSVFKGTLSDSIAIAVKKLEGLRQGEKQFRAEVSTIGKIHHVNLVRLHGFCSQGSNRLLVYEYMPQGSLDSHLFKNKSKVLAWETRYQIALGTARGLAYLHENCRERIIHCDIKPENVLLDDMFCPKVADFGMAKIISRDFSRALTTIRGTIGYLAPEWVCGLPITTKADVYSFGMMLLEIISGKRNTEKSEDVRYIYFPLWAAYQISEDEVLCLLDPKLEENTNIEELKIACRVACWCIQDHESHRPSMEQVVKILEGVVEVGIPPIPISLLNHICSDSDSSQA